MKDVLRITVLWAQGSAGGRHTAELISRHFDGLGMERDGVSHRVPVRFRSAPWTGASAEPLDIDLSQAEHNAIILLFDDVMHEQRKSWSAYIERLRKGIDARGKADTYIAFGSPTAEPGLPADTQRNTQYARRDRWHGTLEAQARDHRLLLHLLFRLRALMRDVMGVEEHEPLFVSHAKADGDATAQAIVDYVNHTSQDVPLKAFYDAKELAPGEDFEQVFQDEIRRGTLLAIVSDVYDSRPWCVFELTIAKRACRPIVLADVGRQRISRTYPYGANLPRVRISAKDDDDRSWIEPLLVEALSEGLRCDLFQLQAALALDRAGVADRLVLPRPPELFDLVDRETLPGTIVYPDPPVGRIEQELLTKALSLQTGAHRLLPLGELR